MRLLGLVQQPVLLRACRSYRTPTRGTTDRLAGQAKRTTRSGKKRTQSVTQDIGGMVKEAGHTVKEQAKQALQTTKGVLRGHRKSVLARKGDTVKPPSTPSWLLHAKRCSWQWGRKQGST